MKSQLFWNTVLTGLLAAAAFGDSDTKIRADLEPFEEVPSVSSTAEGQAEGSIAADGRSLTISVKYEKLEAPPIMSHIHMAQRGVNGGIVLWICGSAANPGPAGTPLCPAGLAGTYSRTLTANEVNPAAAQGIDAGQFAEIVRAIRAGKAYVNLHSTRFPGGELRGQIRANGGSDRD